MMASPEQVDNGTSTAFAAGVAAERATTAEETADQAAAVADAAASTAAASADQAAVAAEQAAAATAGRDELRAEFHAELEGVRSELTGAVERLLERLDQARPATEVAPPPARRDDVDGDESAGEGTDRGEVNEGQDDGHNEGQGEGQDAGRRRARRPRERRDDGFSRVWFGRG